MQRAGISCATLVVLATAISFPCVSSAFINSGAPCGLRTRAGAQAARCTAALPHRASLVKPFFQLRAAATGSLGSSSDASGASQQSGITSGKVGWGKLLAKDFRHPVDLRATRTLERLFPFPQFFRQGPGGVVEQAVYLDNMSTSIRVGPTQLPRIHASVQQALKLLDLEDCAVDVFVKQNSSPNAYTMAMQGKKPFIVIHSSLIDLMSEAELQAVIAHELGHLKCEHGVFITMANLLALVAENLPFVSLFSDAMRGAMMQWMQAAELTCDRAALLVSQDPKVVVSVIMKLTGGSAGYAGELDANAFLTQARDFEEASQASWIGRRMAQSAAQALTHPLPVTRVRELDRWAQSDEYQALIARGAPL